MSIRFLDAGRAPWKEGNHAGNNFIIYNRIANLLYWNLRFQEPKRTWRSNLQDLQNIGGINSCFDLKVSFARDVSLLKKEMLNRAGTVFSWRTRLCRINIAICCTWTKVSQFVQILLKLSVNWLFSMLKKSTIEGIFLYSKSTREIKETLTMSVMLRTIISLSCSGPSFCVPAANTLALRSFCAWAEQPSTSLCFHSLASPS